MGQQSTCLGSSCCSAGLIFPLPKLLATQCQGLLPPRDISPSGSMF